MSRKLGCCEDLTRTKVCMDGRVLKRGEGGKGGEQGEGKEGGEQGEGREGGEGGCFVLRDQLFRDEQSILL